MTTSMEREGAQERISSSIRQCTSYETN